MLLTALQLHIAKPKATDQNPKPLIRNKSSKSVRVLQKCSAVVFMSKYFCKGKTDY